MTPDDRKYAKTHEWVKLEDDTAVIGISDHAQESLGDITFIELPSVGDSYSADDEFGVIESVKAASDLYAPVGGEVVAINEKLSDAPELVNEKPYDDGWIIKMKNVDAQDVENLMTSDEYEATLD